MGRHRGGAKQPGLRATNVANCVSSTPFGTRQQQLQMRLALCPLAGGCERGVRGLCSLRAPALVRGARAAGGGSRRGRRRCWCRCRVPAAWPLVSCRAAVAPVHAAGCCRLLAANERRQLRHELGEGRQHGLEGE
jgi:hypothetical protein